MSYEVIGKKGPSTGRLAMTVAIDISDRESPRITRIKSRVIAAKKAK